MPEPERVALCDLLIGRQLRYRARRELWLALELELALEGDRSSIPKEAVTELLEAAVSWELMALRAERGQILWGLRHNRCGRPEDI